MAEASILSSKPKLKDLNKYRELDEEWYSLGIELEIDDKELDDLEDKYSDPHRRMIKMFGVWLSKGENPTYEKLIKALAVINKRDIAESLCTQLGKPNLILIIHTLGFIYMSLYRFTFVIGQPVGKNASN